MTKKKLRKKIITRRKKFFFQIIPSNNILDKINSKINLTKKKTIGGYFPINFEFDCLEILKKFYLSGYNISLPVIEKNNQMNFYLWNIYDPLILSSLGIPQPKKLKKVFPDILFVPVVAFDKYNNRIGYGGGFYDRYLDKIIKIKKCFTIGLAFSNQKVTNIKAEPFDKKLDLILTEKFIQK